MEPIVETRSGKVRGATLGGVHIFKGIPYGAPTGGAYRFQAPKAPTPWTGVRDTLAYGPNAPQATPAELGSATAPDPQTAARRAAFMAFLHGLSGDEPPMSEDCLVLNVWSGGLGPNEKKPVLVFLHGGAFATGSGSWPLYEGTGLARRGDAVVVTLNHRLGALGYLYLAELGGRDYAASGNAGMLDIVLALEWIRDNIGNFGGDPGRVMIFGSSGGASKCSTLMAMPAAKGLFHRANLMSGPMMRACPAEIAARNTEKLLARLDLPRKDFHKLHDLPAERLVQEAEHIGVPINAGLASAASPEAFMPLQPVVEGQILPAHPMDPVASPCGRDVPIMIGSTKDDMKMIMLGMPWYGTLDEDGLREMLSHNFGASGQEILAAYRRERPQATPSDIACAFVTDRVMWAGAIAWAERKADAGAAPVFVYRFDFESAAMGGVLGATHGGDIPFAMNNYEFSSMAGNRPENAAMGQLMGETWVRFAETGDPNHAGLPRWDPYTPDKRATMLFDVTPKVVDDLRAELRVLLNKAGAVG